RFGCEPDDAHSVVTMLLMAPFAVARLHMLLVAVSVGRFSFSSRDVAQANRAPSQKEGADDEEQEGAGNQECVGFPCANSDQSHCGLLAWDETAGSRSAETAPDARSSSARAEAAAVRAFVYSVSTERYVRWASKMAMT